MATTADAPALDAQSAVRQSTETVRQTTKWITAAFAAVGAVLIAGIQISNLGRVEWSWRALRAWLAVTGILLALGAVGWVIWYASRVLTERFITVGQVNQHRADIAEKHGEAAWRWDPMLEKLQTETNYLYSGTSIRSLEDLEGQISDISNELEELETKAARGEALPPNRDLTTVADDAAQLDGVAQRVVDFANYHETEWRFLRFRTYSLWAGIVAALGVTMFAWATNPPRPTAEVKSPMMVKIAFSEEGKNQLGTKLGKECVAAPQVPGIAVNGDLREPDVVIMPSKHCKAQLIRLRQALGVTIPQLKGQTGPTVPKPTSTSRGLPNTS